MIVDHLKNYTMYLSVNSNMSKGFEFIRKYLENELPEGRYEVDGENVYAMVQSYETTPEKDKKWEAHKEYIDLQYVVCGKETIYWTHEKTLVPCAEYNSEKDYTLYEGPEGTGVKLSNGYYSILFPEDAHKPGCIWDEKQTIKKIVVKVKYSEE